MQKVPIKARKQPIYASFQAIGVRAWGLETEALGLGTGDLQKGAAMGFLPRSAVFTRATGRAGHASRLSNYQLAPAYCGSVRQPTEKHPAFRPMPHPRSTLRRLEGSAFQPAQRRLFRTAFGKAKPFPSADGRSRRSSPAVTTALLTSVVADRRYIAISSQLLWLWSQWRGLPRRRSRARGLRRALTLFSFVS
jgi:hypothetical protein